MNRRIQQFLNAENITQSQFADSINVARASVSHIIAGRNKPGFDFIENMARRYPSLNLEWLITGKGRMYKSDDDANTLFSEPAVSPAPLPEVVETPLPAPKTPEIDIQEEAAATPENPTPAEQKPVQKAENSPTTEPAPAASQPAAEERAAAASQPVCSSKTIKKMIVLFSDGTYQELMGME